MPEPMLDRQPLYYRDSPDVVIEHDLDGLRLVFHRPSGITHIIASPLPEIFALLSEEACSVQDIWQHLSREYDLEGESEGLAQHLDELAALGLARVTQ